MKHVLRILIIVIFFVLVFVPRTVIGILNYWLLFVLLFLVVFIFLYSEYYVSKKAVRKILNKAPDFSVICEKVPLKNEKDFIRGRLVVYNSMVLLYSKQQGKSSLAWSRDISRIDSIEFGKLSTNKKGFTLISGFESFEFATDRKSVV